MFVVRIDEAADDRIRHVADTGLERQEVLRHTTLFDLNVQEVDEVLGHRLGDVVHGRERTRLIRDVRRHDELDLGRITGNERRTDASVGTHHRNRKTIRRIERHIHVVHAL